MNNLKIILLFLIYPSIILCQNKTYIDKFELELKKKAIEYKSEINFNKAKAFYLNKNWDSTLVYSMKQLSTNHKTLADYCFFLRGISFRKKGLYNQAEKELTLVSNKFIFYPLVNFNFGLIAAKTNKYQKAINYYLKADSALINKNNTSQINKINMNIGNCYIHLKQYQKAEKYLFKNNNLLLSKGDSLSLFESYTNIANLYYEQYKDKEALIYFEKAYTLSKKIKDFEKKFLGSINMAVFEENRGNYKQAFVYRKESEQWKDSLNNQNKIWAVADYEKKYAIAQKQKQISVLEVENKLKETQRKTMFFSVLGMLLLLVGGMYAYAQKVKNAKIILSQKVKLDELNATKDQLFSIVSHDLRSSVNALKTSNTKLTNSLETKNYSQLDQLLQQNNSIANGAYSLLDNLLHWALLQTKQLYFSKDSVHLFSIVQQIEYNYKSLLLDKAITFENAVSKNSFIFVDLDSLKIVLRNLLDNAIKFSHQNGQISMYTVETNNDFCQLVIEDTGLGMSQNTINELLQDNELLAKKSNSEIIGTGLGMQLCKQMIKKNGGTLAIESEPNKGTKIILTFPKTAV
ncbi:tetratricopeptide repeat-containing sensor histidine kinase [Flavobacterium sp. WC2509]|uniref:tetratricopeptide repeat-containing sensor histidine kinase n=1 Tax=Flavobacterium sp. WC2509 TaxID=3461406 RepID=UPI004044227B